MDPIKTQDDFKAFAAAFWGSNKAPYATGIGQTFTDTGDEVIAVKWLTVNVDNNLGTAAAIMHYIQENGVEANADGIYRLTVDDAAKIIETYFGSFLDDGKQHDNINALASNADSFTFIRYMSEKDWSGPSTSMEDVHFKLALMTRQLRLPNTMEMGDIFGFLPNLIWTNMGVYTLSDWNRIWLSGENVGEVALAQDKFPPMYWANPAPAGVRVANTTMMRHGHHAAPESTYMHYASGNFNAGTLGKAMVEGRLSAGTTIGAGSDVGAGAGFLGTLSGGNSIKMKMGENSLLGAMAECGIPVGDNVLIKEGVVFSAGTLVKVINWKKTPDGKFEVGDDKKPIVESEDIVKAITLEGISNVTFRVHSQTGALEVIPVPNKVSLNDMLHKNDGLQR